MPDETRISINRCSRCDLPTITKGWRIQFAISRHLNTDGSPARLLDPRRRSNTRGQRLMAPTSRQPWSLVRGGGRSGGDALPIAGGMSRTVISAGPIIPTSTVESKTAKAGAGQTETQFAPVAALSSHPLQPSCPGAPTSAVIAISTAMLLAWTADRLMAKARRAATRSASALRGERDMIKSLYSASLPKHESNIRDGSPRVGGATECPFVTAYRALIALALVKPLTLIASSGRNRCGDD